MGNGNYFQPEIECASQEQIRAWQNERLCRTVRRVYENVAYYRNLMDKKGVTPDDVRSVDDLHKLPFLTKDDLRNAYPYGLLACPRSECVRIQSTSGTTGKRVVAFYTQHDIDLWDDCCARALAAAGGTRDDVVHVCYGYGLFTGGPGLNGGSHKLGSLTLPMSSGNTERQIQFMCDLESTILCCTPSYASYLAESIMEKGLRDKIKLKAGIFGAEAWSEEMRRDIERTLGIKAYDIYGLTEITGPGVSFECSEQTGMHINEDHFLPKSSTRKPVKCSPREKKGSWYLPVSPRKPFRLSGIARGISVFCPARNAPAAVRTSRCPSPWGAVMTCLLSRESTYSPRKLKQCLSTRGIRPIIRLLSAA